MSETRPSPQINTTYTVFAHHRRRTTLRVLLDYETPIALADLADEVAVHENETRLEEVSPKEVKRIYLSLYHSHIPKLKEAGFVQYDQDQDLVTLLDAGGKIEDHQERILAE